MTATVENGQLKTFDFIWKVLVAKRYTNYSYMLVNNNIN